MYLFYSNNYRQIQDMHASIYCVVLILNNTCMHHSTNSQTGICVNTTYDIISLHHIKKIVMISLNLDI